MRKSVQCRSLETAWWLACKHPPKWIRVLRRQVGSSARTRPGFSLLPGAFRTAAGTRPSWCVQCQSWCPPHVEMKTPSLLQRVPRRFVWMCFIYLLTRLLKHSIPQMICLIQMICKRNFMLLIRFMHLVQHLLISSINAQRIFINAWHCIPRK